MSDLRRQLNSARTERDELRQQNANLRQVLGDIAPEYAEAYSLLCDIALNGMRGDDLGTTTTTAFESRPPRHHPTAYHRRNEERRQQRQRAQKIRADIAKITGGVEDHPLHDAYNEDADTRTRRPRGQVYFCQAIHGGPIKIGIAADPDARLRELQIASPVPLKMIATIPGSEATERHLHEHFSEWRLHGEWFDEKAEGLAALITKAQSHTPYPRRPDRSPGSAQPSQNTLAIRPDMLNFAPVRRAPTGAPVAD